MSNLKRRIPGIPDHFQHFFLSLIFQLILPLLPMLFEFWISGKLSDKSLTLVASIYAISVGVSSSSRLLFGATVIISIVFSVAHGIVSSSVNPLPGCRIYSIISIGCVFIIHSAERWNRHIVDGDPFWKF